MRPRQPRLDMERMRSAKPLRNPSVSFLEGEHGSLLLTAPLEVTRGGLVSILVRRMNLPPSKQFELDPVGAFVWEQCDGSTRFSTIAARLRSRFKMNRLEAEASLATYLQTLNRRRLVTAVFEDGKSASKLKGTRRTPGSKPLSAAGKRSEPAERDDPIRESSPPGEKLE